MREQTAASVVSSSASCARRDRVLGVVVFRVFICWEPWRVALGRGALRRVGARRLEKWVVGWCLSFGRGPVSIVMISPGV